MAHSKDSLQHFAATYGREEWISECYECLRRARSILDFS